MAEGATGRKGEGRGHRDGRLCSAGGGVGMSWTWAAGAGTDTRGARGRGRRRRRRAYGCGRQTIEGRHNGLSGAGAGRRMWWMWFGWGAGIRIPTTPTGPESRRLPGQQGQRADRWGSPKGTWVRGGRRGGTPGATPHARDSRVRKALQRYGTGAAVARAAGGEMQKTGESPTDWLGTFRKASKNRPRLVLFERPQKYRPRLPARAI